MLVAARNSFLMSGGGPSTPTAKDYVQDGLVAMWDGIENAGWKKHDANATTWKGLVGGADLTLHGSTAWGDDALHITASSGYASLASMTGGYLTQEMVVSIGRAGALMALFLGTAGWYDKSSRGMAVRANGTINFAGAGKFIPSVGVGASHTISAIFAAATSSDVLGVYVDSNSAVASGSGMYGLGSGPGLGVGSMAASYPSTGSRYFCIRLYSRALTAAEIAANYAVDKARFNLP